MLTSIEEIAFFISLVIQPLGSRRKGLISKRAILLVTVIVAITLALWLAYRLPNERRIESLFRNEHPTYLVLSVTKQGGDSVAQYYISYRTPGGKALHQDVWMYYSRPPLGWHLYSKTTVR